MQLSRAKSGFNLIEIAIVLAVIGLVIGGIYTAASAVTENNRRQALQKQLLQIVQNVRNTYATQPSFVIPTYAQIKALALFPGDLTDNGTAFLNPYGGVVELTVDTYSPTGNQMFRIYQHNVPQGACINLLTMAFGSAASIQQIGLLMAASTMGNVSVANGIQMDEATITCSGSVNDIWFDFSLH